MNRELTGSSADPVVCTMCGTCCTAPDISSLNKPLGVRCRNLRDDCTCAVYEYRPEVCRRYKPDFLCGMVAAPTLAERTERYLNLFAMEKNDQS